MVTTARAHRVMIPTSCFREFAPCSIWQRSRLSRPTDNKLLNRGEIVETFETVDYFSDAELITDPYPYFDHLRGQCPVLPGGSRGRRHRHRP